MAILSSSRNLLIFGGLGVFALGWGGGLLLGAFSSPDAPPPPAQPQLVDADTLSSAQEAEKAEAQKSQSSSLLEQVFGLDDLEEENPAKPAPRNKPAPAEAARTAPPIDVSKGTSDPAEEELPSAEPSNEPVQLEESEEAEDAGAVPPATAEAEPDKDILGENPYK